MKLRELSETEITTLTGALHTATERYRECVGVVGQSDLPEDAKGRLVTQFNWQIADCSALLERLEA